MLLGEVNFVDETVVRVIHDVVFDDGDVNPSADSSLQWMGDSNFGDALKLDFGVKRLVD